MFLLNSCLGHFSAASLEAPLLPKLRGHFAEFLNNTSSVGLRILSSSTCVGLRYGLIQSNSGFSRRLAHLLPYYSSVRVTPLVCTAAFPTVRLLRLHRSSHSRPRLSFRVPTVLSVSGTGLSTCSPSATPSGLALGPDSPRADQLYPGNLGYSAVRIPTLLSLLIPAFSLPVPPLPLPVQLPRSQECSPTNHLWFHGFGGVFQPRTFSARGLSASELLRTL